MRLIERQTSEVDRPPPGYGLAWYRGETGMYICYPWPLNLILGWLRHVYLLLRYARSPDKEGQSFRVGRVEGLREGYRLGYLDGIKGYFGGMRGQRSHQP